MPQSYSAFEVESTRTLSNVSLSLYTPVEPPASGIKAEDYLALVIILGGDYDNGIMPVRAEGSGFDSRTVKWAEQVLNFVQGSFDPFKTFSRALSEAIQAPDEDGRDFQLQRWGRRVLRELPALLPKVHIRTRTFPSFPSPTALNLYLHPLVSSAEDLRVRAPRFDEPDLAVMVETMLDGLAFKPEQVVECFLGSQGAVDGMLFDWLRRQVLRNESPRWPALGKRRENSGRCREPVVDKLVDTKGDRVLLRIDAGGWVELLQRELEQRELGIPIIFSPVREVWVPTAMVVIACPGIIV